MKKILFLDDSAERHKTFIQNSIGLVSDRVYNAKDAIAKLASNDYEIIMLDHDLDSSFEGIILKGAEDGRMVVRAIIESGRHKNADIIIHSPNHPAALEMQMTLTVAGYPSVWKLPFAWEKIKVGATPDEVLFL